MIKFPAPVACNREGKQTPKLRLEATRQIWDLACIRISQNSQLMFFKTKIIKVSHLITINLEPS